jgi:hypothetical protein
MGDMLMCGKLCERVCGGAGAAGSMWWIWMSNKFADGRKKSKSRWDGEERLKWELMRVLKVRSSL